MKSLLKLFSALAALAGLLSACSFADSSDPVRVRIDVDRPVLHSGSSERVVLKVCLDGLRLTGAVRRPPVNIALVIDRSGSMNGEKIEKAREAAIEILRRLTPDDVFSLVAYDNKVSTLISARHVRNKAQMEEAIESLRANGGTALYAGVSQGANELRGHLSDPRFVSRVILLSDGQANVGPSSAQDLARLGTALVQEGISVSTVGLGLGFNEDLMTGLARCSDGNTYFVESGSDLPRIFNAELGDVLDIVARRVVVELDFPEWVRPLAFVGREGRVDGRRAEFSLNQLYAGQEKFALIEVEVAPGKAGDERLLTEACVRFEAVNSNRNLSLRAQSSVRYSEDNYAVDKAVNQSVQTAYASNVLAAAKDEVVVYMDSNRKEAGASALRAHANALLARPAASFNVELKAKAEAALKEADKLEKHGLDNAARKSYRADSAQTTGQQSHR